MASKPYPLRIPENLISLVDAKAREDRTDRSTVLRQLLYAGAEDYLVKLLKRRRISVSRAAELLDVLAPTGFKSWLEAMALTFLPIWKTTNEDERRLGGCLAEHPTATAAAGLGDYLTSR